MKDCTPSVEVAAATLHFFARSMLLMQRREYPLRQRSTDPRHAGEIVDARGMHAANAAELREQRLALFRTDAFDFLQCGCGPCLSATRTMALDRESMRFIADLVQQMQYCMIRRQMQRFVA